jgi:uncharacterized protein YydD (DUF2326 family)
MATTAQEIALMKKDIETLSEDVKELNQKIDMLMIKLLDPDEGLVIRVNKNTERLDERDQNMGKWMKDINDFHHMKRWKNTVTKALWVIYAAIIGFIIKVVFWE